MMRCVFEYFLCDLTPEILFHAVISYFLIHFAVPYELKDSYINRFVPRPRLYLLPKPISWFLGYRSEPTRPIGNVIPLFWACLGAFCGLMVVEAVFHAPGVRDLGTPIVIGSLGATAILEYNTIDSPLAQPRNTVLGQVFSAAIGVGITKLFHLNSNFENLRWIAGALAVGIASAVMGITKTVHPPAGATALLAATSPEMTELGWYLVALILLGSTLMVAVACVLNNIQRQFPMYWWTPMDLSKPKACDIERVDKNGEVEGSNASTGSTYTYEKHDKDSILIEGGQIYIPASLSLDSEEHSMLEILRSKLEERLRVTKTQDTDETKNQDSS